LTGYLFDTTGNYQAAFKLMAVCSVVSVILMASLLPRGRKHDQVCESDLAMKYFSDFSISYWRGRLSMVRVPGLKATIS
jgi:hypothetical protein